MKNFIRVSCKNGETRCLSFACESTSFAYLQGKELNYGNAMFAALTVSASVPLKEFRDMGFTKSDIEDWNQYMLLAREHEDLQAGINPGGDYAVFPLLRLFCHSYMLSALDEEAFEGLEDEEVKAFVLAVYGQKRTPGCAVLVKNITYSPFIAKNEAEELIAENLTDFLMFALQHLGSVVGIVTPKQDVLLKARLKENQYLPLKAAEWIYAKELFADA
ncbi:MAG: hypothetical protein LIO86_13890 [Lachnospiraceae bacterium]|nr:hypothetical protein [Lachnospiraceae bacterium]